MPLYKAWNSSRTLKKAVIATTLSEFIAKSNKKLDQEDDNVRVFMEVDGTEVDEDEILLSLDPGTVLIVGTSWQPADTPPTTNLAKDDGETPIHTTSADASEENFASEVLEKKKEDSQPHTSKEEQPTAFGAFSNLKYANAKMKGLKIFTEKDIKETKIELERRRRQFWNEKAEQLCKKRETAKLDKTTLYGIIDVSWTLRKTALLETDANAALNDEQVLFAENEISSGRKLGRQKKDTLKNNLERVRIAHNQVEMLNEELEAMKKNFSSVTTAKERGRLQTEYKPKMVVFDGAYSELKRAQEALAKAIKQKRSEMERELKKTAEPEEKKKKII